jgi:hypothetical protein
MANEQNLKPFTGADDPRRMNGKPKGTKHLSTWIQDMLNDPEFETTLLDSKKGIQNYKGAPLKAIIGVAIHKSIHDKDKGTQWAEWLAKHGYGTRQVIEVEDPRKEILEQYMGNSNAGKTEETPS